MKKHWKRGLTFGLSLLMLLNPPLSSAFSGSRLFSLSYAAERPALVTATALNVRSGPGTGSAVVGKLAYGAAVTVLGEASVADGVQWYQIRFTGDGGAVATGYVMGTYLKFSSDTFTSGMDFEAYLDSQGFPESYRPGLRELHSRYPQWIFTAFDTGLDWNEVIQNESQVGRNLVETSRISSWKSTAAGAYDWNTSTWPGFDGSRWVAASEGIIRYYMDPRNFLNETYIFQFLLQNYDASIHTREGLASMVKGTFLEGYGTVDGVYNGTTGAVGSTAGSSILTGPTGTSAGNETAAGNGNESASAGNEAVSGGNSSAEIGIGPGYSSGAASGGQNSTAGTASGGQSSTETTSGAQNNAGTGDFSNVWKGIAPGNNISRNSGEGLSISRNAAERVAATVVRIGPGENPATGENGASGTVAPGAASGITGTDTLLGASSGTAGSAEFSGNAAPYVDILLQAGVQSGVSPYVLAAMILQEQGRDGKSNSISGTGGFYNFYNFEAYASNGMTAVQRGLWYASQSGSYLRPWNSADKAIIGGAIQYGQNYMEAGQNTFYLKKFNVQGSNLYKHQYMTNVEGAAAEGAKMGDAYSESMRQTAMHFSIPVYRNMPAEASAKPAGDGNPNNKLQSLAVNGYALTPAFNRDTETYEVTVGSTDTSVILQAVPSDASASVSGTGTIMLYSAVTEVKILVTAQNGTVREYTLRINRGDTGTSPAAGTAPVSGSGSVSPGGNTPAGTEPSAENQSVPGTGAAPSAGSSHTGPGGSNVTIVY